MIHILQLIWDFLNPTTVAHQAFAPLLIPLGMSLINGISGYSQSRKADKAIEELGRNPFPQYSLDPKLGAAYNRAEQMTKYDFEPEQEAQFQNQLSRSGNTAFQKSIDMSGGNLSSALNRGLQSQNLNAIGDWRAKGAAMRLGKIKYADALSQAIQHQENLKTQAGIQRRTALEEAYGNQKRIGKENLLNSASGLGAQAFQYGMYDKYFSGNGKVPPTGTSASSASYLPSLGAAPNSSGDFSKPYQYGSGATTNSPEYYGGTSNTDQYSMYYNTPPTLKPNMLRTDG